MVIVQYFAVGLLIAARSASADADRSELLGNERYESVRLQGGFRIIESVGGCRFGFFAPGSDNRLLIDVVVSDGYVRIVGEPFNFAVPLAEVLPDRWTDSGNEFVCLGSDNISIGPVDLAVDVVLKKGGPGDQVVVYYNKVSGLIGFRFGLVGPEYRAVSIPRSSVLSCIPGP